MRPAVIDGMHGLGDNVHQRALIRHLMKASDNTLWLKTPWPCLYHDLVGDRLHLADRGHTLRTQAKNAKRERARYGSLPPFGSMILRVWYDPASVVATGSFLGGMFRTTLRYDVAQGDFTLPVPPEWRAKAAVRMARPDRPIMVLRPLVIRREWGGCDTRNPSPDAYRELFNAIRPHFFVVSIADLAAGHEWLVGKPLDADVAFHAGELDAEAITGLIASAALTFCSPGFAIPLSQAVGTPVISIFGGRESARFYQYGERFAPTLGIDPIRPCECFSHNHRCDKRIDLAVAHDKIAQFIEAHCHASQGAQVLAQRAADRLDRPAHAILEPG